MMNPLPVIGCTIVLLVVCAWILSLGSKKKSIRQTPTTPYDSDRFLSYKGYFK